ncbi:cytochrome c4 [Methylicorpusculum oleiharenae]|uniref:c-type cytochrome n=1 Tax=Methylicorpusculum oleiharenae TaxID=1338687 RepID=UPI001357B39A|nr:c-type cytochrome [Methylicorpusculum oleiharenae]MCD2448955.1 cytochrome c4 [Methylicorpusculum oleiharenae]
MKYIILFISLLAPVLASAGPSTEVAWTPETLNRVKEADLVKGKKLAESCAGCHGENGVSAMSEYPSLAGQVANYTYKQLMDYAKGHRVNTLMTSIAGGLSEQDAADLAGWFSSLPRPAAKKADNELAKALKLVEAGDGKRIIPPCFTCHGGNGQGEKMDIPALAGQQADYTANTLLAYKKGERHNDIYSRMRLIVQQLSESEIRELAQYYQQME